MSAFSLVLGLIYVACSASVITGTVFLVLADWTKWTIAVMAGALIVQWLAFGTASASVQSLRSPHTTRTCFNSTFWVWLTNIVAGCGCAALSFLLLICLSMCTCTTCDFSFQPVELRRFYQACSTNQQWGTGLTGAALGLLVICNVFMLVWQLCYRCRGKRTTLPVYVHKSNAAPSVVPVAATVPPVQQPQFVAA